MKWRDRFWQKVVVTRGCWLWIGGTERHGMAKLTKSKVRKIRRDLKAGASQRQLADELGLNPSTISYVAREKTWRGVL